VLAVLIVDVFLGLDEWRWLRGVALEQKVLLDEVRRPNRGVVVQEYTARYREHRVELLERELLGLWHKAEDADEGKEIQSCIEAEGTDLTHGRLHRRVGEAKYASEDEVDANGPRHALLTVDSGEDLSAVLERDRPFSERVEHREDVDEPMEL
jgi:hypothetical protein